PHPVPLHVLLYDLDILILFLFYSSSHHRHLHSFPTRRSSDLPPPAYRAQTTVSTPTASVTSWERERPRRTPRRERRENFTGTSSPADDLVDSLIPGHSFPFFCGGVCCGGVRGCGVDAGGGDCGDGVCPVGGRGAPGADGLVGAGGGVEPVCPAASATFSPCPASAWPAFGPAVAESLAPFAAMTAPAASPAPAP